MHTLTKTVFVLVSVVLIFGLAPVALAQDVTVTTLYSVRLREGPGTDFAVVTTIPFNVVLQATGRNEDSSWIEVNYEGQTGWVAARLVRVRGPLNALSVGGAQPPTQGDVSLTITNQTDVGLTLVFSGPARYTLYTPAGESKTFQIVAGTYDWVATAPGYRASRGTETFHSGDGVELVWHD